ncbi:MAG: 1,4-alpha-glucan-branching enzyme [Marinilabiliales bacterium]|nr:MAG: 1,4-alpha-glucan-branching enzyme [Marinilabiliales bacterium]
METPGIIKTDPWLKPWEKKIVARQRKAALMEEQLTGGIPLKEFANGHLFFGVHREGGKLVFREWAPNAEKIFLTGSFSDWRESDEYSFSRSDNGVWELSLESGILNHTGLYRLSVSWKGGRGSRIPAYARRVVQDPDTLIFNAQYWDPPDPYKPVNTAPDLSSGPLLIYEAHTGMATEEQRTGTFNEFREQVLPYIHRAGYNTIQLMAVQEHPYYGSFGYHVSNFFAASSRFGTPDELRRLIDDAHGMGMAVIMDLVHSHAVKNVNEGLAELDGTGWQYFHSGARREHAAWDSLCFNYGKPEVAHFLLSNCKFWIDEYGFDGYRFDGVTSMLYLDHGLERRFTGYDDYFDGNQDEDAIAYLTLAGKLIHQVKPGALCIAEEMSGMPGLAAPAENGGIGFDYRLSMGIPDYWIKIIKELPDERWNTGEIWHELTQKRVEEKTVSYAESHDQALVGDKTIAFRLMDKEMYDHMDKSSQSLIIDRGMALHKMIRLATIATAGGGYLNFMGNEFGHPEWIDFPREGNNWSYFYARRQWSLAGDKRLRYHQLGDFDREMISLIRSDPAWYTYQQHLVHNNEVDQVMAFTRGSLLFVFNFNPSASFSGYGIKMTPGRYRVKLTTDKAEFGGFGRIDENIEYVTEWNGKVNSPHFLNLYIPSRTAVVFEKQKAKSIYDRGRA